MIWIFEQTCPWPVHDPCVLKVRNWIGTTEMGKSEWHEWPSKLIPYPIRSPIGIPWVCFSFSGRTSWCQNRRREHPGCYESVDIGSWNVALQLWLPGEEFPDSSECNGWWNWRPHRIQSRDARNQWSSKLWKLSTLVREPVKFGRVDGHTGKSIETICRHHNLVFKTTEVGSGWDSAHCRTKELGCWPKLLDSWIAEAAIQKLMQNHRSKQDEQVNHVGTS